MYDGNELINSRSSDKIFFTSDFHFGHNKEFIYKNRGFNNVTEMNIALYERYNEVVNDDDIVIILGDCLFYQEDDDRDNPSSLKYLRGLKGYKYLVIGNHDSGKKLELFEKEHIFEKVLFGFRFDLTKTRQGLVSHYPFKVENFTHENVYSIHGHKHTNNGGVLDGYNLDIGVDNFGKPISLAQIKEIILR